MSALTEKIAAEHALTYDEQRVRHVCTCRGWLDDDGDRTHLAHVAEVTEAAARDAIATELAETARQFRATSDEMGRIAMAREAHDFDRDDVIRYGAYASAWESAAAQTIARTTPTKEQ